MNISRSTLVAGVAALCLLGLSACSKVNPDNYAKIKSGMSREDIHDLLGKPDDVSGSGLGSLTLTTETWNGESHNITVTYAGEKATIKTIEPTEPQK